MVTIGHLNRESGGGFSGQLSSFSFQAPLQIMVNNGADPAIVSFSVWSNGREIGSGNLAASPNGSLRLQLAIFDPLFGSEPILGHVKIGPGDKEGDIIWEPKE